MTSWLIVFVYVAMGAVSARLVRKHWKLQDHRSSELSAEDRRLLGALGMFFLWPLAWVPVVVFWDPPESFKLPKPSFAFLRRPKPTVEELEQAVGIEPLEGGPYG
jgi:hypothetical protein